MHDKYPPGVTATAAAVTDTAASPAAYPWLAEQCGFLRWLVGELKAIHFHCNSTWSQIPAVLQQDSEMEVHREVGRCSS